MVGRGPTALGALRSLRLAGIPTFVACPRDDQTTRSRWYRPMPGPTPWRGTLDRPALATLHDLPFVEAVLIPCADDAALWLADLRQSDLASRFKVSTSSRATLEILQDKVRFANFLAGTDIPHPRTYSIGSSADIDLVPFDELDRVFIKPADSQKFSDITGAKAVWAHNRRELAEIWHRLDRQGFKLLAQEYVPGSAADHYFVDGFRDRNGALTGLLARRRTRIFPPDFGNSSYCTSIALKDVPGPIDSVTRLLSKLDYRGIFSAEFKRDARDGKYRILEVNTRAWTYVEFAARCGVNVCEMAWQDAKGQPVTVASTDYPVGAGCVDLYRDINSIRTQEKAVRGPLSRILWQWARAHFHSFRLDDPGPAIAVLWRILARHGRRRLGVE